MFDKIFLIVSLIIIKTHCDSDNSVEVCTTLTVPNYNTICLSENKNEKLVALEEKLVALEEKLDTKLDQVLDILKNMTGKQELDEEITTGQEGDILSGKIFHSCDEIRALYPDNNSPSGLYNITNCDGHHHTVYCSMENTCGDAKGGWMRIGYLNMSDPNKQCPPGFRLYEENGVRACGRQASGCQSVKFTSYNMKYSRVCGRIIGYQKGTTDALIGKSNGINGAYVDGVSITRGSPRSHVWTFVASLQENYHYSSNKAFECPCAPNSPVTPPSFVGNDYFCESGVPGSFDASTLYTSDPLWDGKQCGLIEEACCNVTGIPWFNKVLQQPTTDYIELRICGSESYVGEDVPVGLYEIYVK